MGIPLNVQVGGPTSLPDGQTPVMLGGKSAEGIVAELHGKWYTGAYRGNVFHGFVTGVTVPVVASGLVSVASLYNPAGSQRNLEVISTDVGIVLATQVVNHVGLYFQAGIGSNTSIPTSQTVGTPVNGMLGAGAVSQGKFLTAATHVGTPVLAAMIATFGATTTTADNPIHYDFDGKLILPPGSIVSFATSTAASTASGLAVGISWAEWPL